MGALFGKHFSDMHYSVFCYINSLSLLLPCSKERKYAKEIKKKAKLHRMTANHTILRDYCFCEKSATCALVMLFQISYTFLKWLSSMEQCNNCFKEVRL